MKILVLDNYDSFVYNLVHMLRELGQAPDIYRNDKISLEEIDQYDKILLSPLSRLSRHVVWGLWHGLLQLVLASSSAARKGVVGRASMAA
ncbi:MAG: hypothetical protein AAFU64_18910, partial [Bacteroidota bacterium]